MLPFRSTRLTLAMLLGTWSLAVAAPRGACAAADRPVVFDIPAQSLDAALAQYFRATGVQLLYDSALAAGRRSAALRGTFGQREALRRLLDGTGLVVRYSRTNAAIITRPDSAAKTPRLPLVPLGRVFVRERIQTPASPVERLAYYGVLETQLQHWLRSDPRSRRLSFDISVRVRIDIDGKLTDIRIARGTRDRKVDQVLVATLAAAAVTPPPSGLQQPLAIVLRGARR